VLTQDELLGSTSGGLSSYPKARLSLLRIMESKQSESGWMYMLRTTQQHHVQLSLIADQKANILLACNSIILSLSLSRMDFIKVYWCTYSMLSASVISMLLALLVVAPLSLKKKRPQPDDRNFNVLFFGHFTSLPFDQFRDRMFSTMESSESVQEAMVKDIYQIGKVLTTRKYLFLKWSSSVFMLGVILSVILLVIQMMS
jgi:hypothetical protein